MSGEHLDGGECGGHSPTHEPLHAFLEGGIISSTWQKQRLGDANRGHLFKGTPGWYQVWGTGLFDSGGGLRVIEPQKKA